MLPLKLSETVVQPEQVEVAVVGRQLRGRGRAAGVRDAAAGVGARCPPRPMPSRSIARRRSRRFRCCCPARRRTAHPPSKARVGVTAWPVELLRPFPVAEPPSWLQVPPVYSRQVDLRGIADRLRPGDGHVGAVGGDRHALDVGARVPRRRCRWRCRCPAATQLLPLNCLTYTFVRAAGPVLVGDHQAGGRLDDLGIVGEARAADPAGAQRVARARSQPPAPPLAVGIVLRHEDVAGRAVEDRPGDDRLAAGPQRDARAERGAGRWRRWPRRGSGCPATASRSAVSSSTSIW